MNKYKSAFLVLTVPFVFSCGGGGGGETQGLADANAPGALSGYVVDDYVLNGTVKVYDAAGNLVATTTSGDYGYFSTNAKEGQNYRVVITGGVQDVDGLASTTDDQRPNTATLTALSLADQSRKIVVSAISTGIEAYAAGDATKYQDKATVVQAVFPGAMYLATGDSPGNVLKGIALATENAGGFSNLVAEFSDDGDLNGSKTVSADTLIQAKTLISSLDKTGIADPALLGCVWDAFDKDPGELTQSIMDSVTELHCSRKGVKSLQGIEQFRNLEEIDLSGNALTSARSLAGLSKLQHVAINNNYLRDLDVSGLADGAYYSLAGNCLTSASKIANNINAVGNNRRQKDPAQCTIPRVLSLRAIARKNNPLEISYKVEDVQSLPCELEVMGQKKTLSCDGNLHVLRLDDLILPEKSTQLVKLTINGYFLDSSRIEYYGYSTVRIRAITVPSTVGPGSIATTVPNTYKLCVDYSIAAISSAPAALSSNAKCSAPGVATASFDVDSWKPASGNIFLHAFFVNSSSNSIIRWSESNNWIMRADGSFSYEAQDICAGTRKSFPYSFCVTAPGVLPSTQ